MSGGNTDVRAISANKRASAALAQLGSVLDLVKREKVRLSQLRPGDECIVAVEPDTCLVVRVVDTNTAENLLFCVPAFRGANGVIEIDASEHKVYKCKLPSHARVERVFLNGRQRAS